MGLFPCVSHPIYTYTTEHTHLSIERKRRRRRRRRREIELGESSTQAIGSHWKPIKLKERWEISLIYMYMLYVYVEKF